MKKSIIMKIFFSIVLLSIVVTGCVSLKMSDLRTGSSISNENEAKARTLLKEMAVAHSISNWDSIETYSVTFQDEFFDLIGKNSHPYKDSKANFRLDYIPNTYDGKMTFLSGRRKGEAWGIQSWKTYENDASGETIFQKNKDAEFWVPTYQYFIEFPARIQKATALSYEGTKIIDGVDCEGVLASWNSTAPQKDIDQYLIWLDKKTSRIVKLEYTIRDMYRFLTGAAMYKNYKDFDGLLLPTKMPVVTNIKRKGLLHEMRILDVEVDVIPSEELRPNNNLARMGDSK